MLLSHNLKPLQFFLNDEKISYIVFKVLLNTKYLLNSFQILSTILIIHLDYCCTNLVKTVNIN